MSPCILFGTTPSDRYLRCLSTATGSRARRLTWKRNRVPVTQKSVGKPLMTSDGHVLIISTVADMATDDVVKRLCSRGIPHSRLNTEDYPFSQTITYRPGEKEHSMLCNGQPIPRPTAVWYRRFRSPSKMQGMDEGIYDFCLQENRAAFLGSIMDLDARWMSHPAAVWQSEYKPYQLRVAARLGLTIPRTLV